MKKICKHANVLNFTIYLSQCVHVIYIRKKEKNKIAVKIFHKKMGLEGLFMAIFVMSVRAELKLMLRKTFIFFFTRWLNIENNGPCMIAVQGS